MTLKNERWCKVSISSLGVTEHRFGNFTPSLIFQGRVIQRLGPLHPETNKQPMFAQLYVLDSNLESTCRYNSLTIPTWISQADKDIMKNHLDTVQGVIHEVNPFVKDFKQIVDIPEEQLQEGQIVISADSRPAHGHARVHN